MIGGCPPQLLGAAVKAELAHARRVNRLAAREGMLGLRRSGAALQPAASLGDGGSGGHRGIIDHRHHPTSTHFLLNRAGRRRRPSAATASTPASDLGMETIGPSRRRQRGIERRCDSVLLLPPLTSRTSATLISQPPPRQQRAVESFGDRWGKTSVLRNSAGSVELTRDSGFRKNQKKRASRQRRRCHRGLDDPVRVAKARVALHESKFALGLPKPCDFEQATLMGLHERLQEANACPATGLGTRYRTVPADRDRLE